MEPSPPTTTIEKTCKPAPGSKFPGSSARCWSTNSAPAIPARNPDTAKATTSTPREPTENARYEQREPGIPVESGRQRAADPARQSDETHLAEAHLPRPPGEHDERQADDREDPDGARELHSVLGQQDRQQYEPEDTEGAEAGVRRAHSRPISQLRRNSFDLACGLPRRGGRARETR